MTSQAAPVAGWPTEVHAHDGDARLDAPFRFRRPSWRPPDEPSRYRPSDGPYSMSFRTCSFCGSIHPEDLYGHLANGAQLEEADWKYGWPHKLYVEGIPNPLALQAVHTGATTKDGVTTPIVGPAPMTVHAKFYAVHVRDCAGDALAAITGRIEELVGIRYQVDERGLSYRVTR